MTRQKAVIAQPVGAPDVTKQRATPVTIVLGGKNMNKKRKYLVGFMAFIVLIGGYTGWTYYRIEQEAKKKADSKFNFILKPEHVREIGYIQDMRVTRELRKHQKKIMWWVKVPSTNRIYSCYWEGGFPEYEKDEGVILIHIPGGTDTVNWDGYIIGLHGSHKGKRTHVWAVDVDDLYFD